MTSSISALGLLIAGILSLAAGETAESKADIAAPPFEVAVAYQCTDAAGNRFFSDRPCAPGQAGQLLRDRKDSSSGDGGRTPAAPRQPSPATDEKPHAGPPPGTMINADGDAVRYPGREWIVETSGFVEAWDPESGRWRRTHALSDTLREAVEHAVAEFNGIPGLDLPLKFSINPDPSISLNNVWKNKNRFIIYVAEDAARGTFPQKGFYSWREKSPGDGAYVGGCSSIVRSRDGTDSYWKTASPGIELSGGMMFLVDDTPRLLSMAKCERSVALRYIILHEMGHCLGLGHETPAPSIMNGTCGTNYYPNDISNFNYLYGSPAR